MRTFHLAALLFAATALISTGCRQTSGPASAGPLSPAGTGALAPVAGGQVPSLNPFGGSTRVTPPATGAYSVPNNYMGGTPIGQAGSVSNGFAQQNTNVIGSGVQVAGWNSSDPVRSVNQQAFAQNPIGTDFLQNNPSYDPNYRGPANSGMRVIDLTGAPDPPGYERPQSSFTTPNWQQQPGQFQQPAFQNPGFQNQGFQNQRFQSQSQAPVFQKPTFQDGVRTINIPARGEIAGNSFGAAPSGSYPRTATAPLPGPSTEPINSNGNSQPQENLMWRRPGTSF